MGNDRIFSLKFSGHALSSLITMLWEEIMGVTIIEVVKVIAPIALEALAKAAVKLVAGTAPLAMVPMADGADGWGDTIDQNTDAYNTNKFSQDYLYYYESMGSQPANGGVVIGASDDIIVWDPSKNENSDITSYMTNIFKDTLSPADSIKITKIVSQLFQARFTEVDLSWTPLSKRFNMPSGLVLDLEMVTAGGFNTAHKPLGIARYCFVAYNPPSH